MQLVSYHYLLQAAANRVAQARQAYKSVSTAATGSTATLQVEFKFGVVAQPH